jgi:hypothetical protein
MHRYVPADAAKSVLDRCKDSSKGRCVESEDTRCRVVGEGMWMEVCGRKCAGSTCVAIDDDAQDAEESG